jgi:hypothetical protein
MRMIYVGVLAVLTASFWVLVAVLATFGAGIVVGSWVKRTGRPRGSAHR